jgi:hypothetical protein
MTRIGLLDSGLGLLGTADALFNLAPDLPTSSWPWIRTSPPMAA